MISMKRTTQLTSILMQKIEKSILGRRKYSRIPVHAYVERLVIAKEWDNICVWSKYCVPVPSLRVDTGHSNIISIGLSFPFGLWLRVERMIEYGER